MFAAGISNKVAETLQWQQQRPSQCPVNQLVFQPQLWHGVHCSQQITGAGKCSLWFPADTHCFITTCSCFSVFQSVTVNMWLPSRGTAITSKCLWHQWTPFGFVIQPLSTEFQPQKRHHAQLALMLWKKCEPGGFIWGYRTAFFSMLTFSSILFQLISMLAKLGICGGWKTLSSSSTLIFQLRQIVFLYADIHSQLPTRSFP